MIVTVKNEVNEPEVRLRAHRNKGLREPSSGSTRDKTKVDFFSSRKFGLYQHACIDPFAFKLFNVHGMLYCPDSKHLTCVRDRVSCLPTECASVRCHNFNTDGRYPSHVDSYQQSIGPFKAVD